MDRRAPGLTVGQGFSTFVLSGGAWGFSGFPSPGGLPSGSRPSGDSSPGSRPLRLLSSGVHVPFTVSAPWPSCVLSSCLPPRPWPRARSGWGCAPSSPPRGRQVRPLRLRRHGGSGGGVRWTAKGRRREPPSGLPWCCWSSLWWWLPRIPRIRRPSATATAGRSPVGSGERRPARAAVDPAPLPRGWSRRADAGPGADRPPSKP